MNQQIQINLNQTAPIKCVCNNESFNQIFFLREVPGILSPTLKPELLPVPAFQCIKCKKIAEFKQKEPIKSQ